jgi:formylglycine-generating enzyme required for sulfatase activity
VVRGGSWGYAARGCRSTIRRGLMPDDLSVDLGFRLLRVAQ